MNYITVEGVDVAVVHKPRNRHSYISIDEGGAVSIKTPLKNRVKIASIIHNRLAWITAKKRELAEKKVLTCKAGESIVYLGEERSLQELSLTCKGNISRCYDRFYTQEAKRLLPQIVDEIAERFGSYPTQLRFRKMRRTYGNCSAKGVVTLNTHLIKLPLSHIRYVIAHELTHLTHMNHSRAFYALLYEKFPQASKIEKELKKSRFLI